MLPHYRPFFLFLLHVVLLLAIPATNAAPTPIDKRIQPVVRRDFSGPTTVTAVSTINSPSGPVTQTCLITLTPVTLPDGSQAVQEVQNCKLSNDAGGNTATISDVTTTVSTLPTNTIAAAPTTNAGLSVNGASTVTAAATPTGDPSPSPDTVATPTTSQAGASTATGLAANGAASVGSPTAAAAQQTTSGSFTIPGKKLSVLPIGLGVFAGISVIALIIVGLVTYERTKYRKAFRQRKLAEAGAQMGYGGMA